MGKTITELTAGKQEQRILRLAPYTRYPAIPRISSTLSQRRSNIIRNTLHSIPNTSWWTFMPTKASPAHAWTNGMISTA